MHGFCKIFQSILGSSIWMGEDSHLRVWIAMLVLKDKNQVVRMSIPGLANIAKVTPEKCRAAIEKFQSPDPDSTSPEFEGRKIQALEGGGWMILNGERYRRMLSLEERNAYKAEKAAEYRARDRAQSDLPFVKRPFSPPTDDEAKFQAEKIGLPGAEVEKFLAYHHSKGWVVGRSPMKDWRRAMQTWLLNFRERAYVSSPMPAPRKDMIAADVEKEMKRLGI